MLLNFRKPFYLFKYKGKNKIIWHYKAYDEAGKLKGDWSTGETNKKAAKLYCLKLYKEGKLIPNNKLKQLRFRDYFKDWFIWDTYQYINKKISRGKNYSKNYAKIQRLNLLKHILPYFGKFKLETINEDIIERWLLSFKGKGLSNTTANHNLQFLKIMFNEAYRLGSIQKNPSIKIEPLKKSTIERGILTFDEVKKIFPDEYP